MEEILAEMLPNARSYPVSLGEMFQVNLLDTDYQSLMVET